MEFFRIKKDIPFMSYGKITTSISLVTFLFAVFFLSTKGLNFGVDFTGGTVIEVHYTQPADLAKVREQLAATGLPDALVQNFGSSHDVLIQVPLKQNLAGAKLSEQVMDGLRKQDCLLPMGILAVRAGGGAGGAGLFGERVGGGVRPDPRKLPQHAQG